MVVQPQGKHLEVKLFLKAFNLLNLIFRKNYIDLLVYKIIKNRSKYNRIYIKKLSKNITLVKNQINFIVLM